jgi:DNA repair exonuclease SbcCD ATPase subunit
MNLTLSSYTNAQTNSRRKTNVREIKLQRLSLKNFQGIKEFTLELNGESASVYADNGKGKTTLLTSFLWLLFDKNADNKKDFAIKTQDAHGNELHNLLHEVEAVLNIDDKNVTLQKVYRENWTQKKGSATEEFTGHKTDYAIDGVPKKKKEFDDYVGNIVKEDLFKLLTSPTFFNEQLTWKEKRSTLLEIAGEITDEDVISSSKELSDLPTILVGRTIDDHRKVINARRTKINDSLKTIPDRIDEVRKAIPEDVLDEEQLRAEIAVIEKDIDDHRTQISNIKNGGAASKLQQDIRELEYVRTELKRDLESADKEKLYALKTKQQEEESNVNIWKRDVVEQERQLQGKISTLEGYKKALDRAKEKYRSRNAEVFEYEDNCECPTCKQELPQDRVEAARELAQTRFNQFKADELAELKQEGVNARSKVVEFEKAIVVIEGSIEETKAKINNKQPSLDKLKKDIQTSQDSTYDVSSNQTYIDKGNEIEALKTQINTLNESMQDSIESIDSEITKSRVQLDDKNRELAKVGQVEQAQNRIAELEQQEKSLTSEYKKLERELYLTDQFTRLKVDMLEARINEKFENVRFRLFKNNINGGLEETCETLYGGVDYSKGLNKAAQINAGLEIITVLQEHFGIRVVTFIDNSESIVATYPVQSQLIKLIVSGADQKLRTEIGGA